MEIFNNLIEISLDAAPWLLLGFVAAGFIKVWLPDDLLSRWLGGDGLWPVTKAAVIGAPLPLCSCGVLPAAMSLRRSGASRSSTVSFLIATPETGVDSIALSYALLGPIMAVIRPLAAIISAIFTGLLTTFVAPTETGKHQQENNCDGGCSAAPSTSCCDKSEQGQTGFLSRSVSALRYGLMDMVDDLVLWLLFGLVLAAAMQTWAPPMMLADWGSGLGAMLLMLLVGIPTYICATASTPIAAALLLAGISPGTVLVFLLAGPATNLATMGVIHKEMGKAVLVTYLVGICVSSITIGLATDAVLQSNNINIIAQVSTGSEWLPQWLIYLSGFILLLAATASLIKKIAANRPPPTTISF